MLWTSRSGKRRDQPARCRRPASAHRPGPRWRSRCPRRGRRTGSGRRQAAFSDSQNSPSLVRAVAERDVGDFVALKRSSRSVDGGDALVEQRPLRRSRSPAGTACRSGSTARRCCSSLWPQCEGICRPPEAGSSFEPDGREEHLVGRDAEREAQRAVAVVGIEPVVAGLQQHAGRGEDRLVTGAADLEVDQALVLELDFLVVEPPRQQHRAVGAEQVVPADARESSAADAALGVCAPAVADRRNLHARRVLSSREHATDKGRPPSCAPGLGNSQIIHPVARLPGAARRCRSAARHA